MLLIGLVKKWYLCEESMISHVKQWLPSLLVGLHGKGCRHLKLHKCNSLQQRGDGQGQSYCLLYALSGQTYLHAAAIWDHNIALSRSFCRSLVSVSPPILLEILESSANRRTVDSFIHRCISLMNMIKKKYWAKDCTLWNTTYNCTWNRVFTINNYSLTAVFEKGCYPLGDNWGQPIPLKFFNE